VVVATQMLESMIIEERPTRAEVTDVASAVFDGVDAVMLSGETAVGKHPVTVVKQMVKILAETEKSAYSNTQPIFYKDSQNVSQAIASAATLMAGAMNAQLMIVPTDSGRTAELMSRHRLEIPILALTTNFGTATRLALRFGVTSTYIPVIDDFEAMLDTAREKALESGLIEKGDYCILTAGHPFNEHGKTNLIKAIQL
ncbi:MAG: pyruvate kinase, partial [Pseudomonadota bacterium]